MIELTLAGIYLAVGFIIAVCVTCYDFWTSNQYKTVELEDSSGLVILTFVWPLFLVVMFGGVLNWFSYYLCKAMLYSIRKIKGETL